MGYHKGGEDGGNGPSSLTGVIADGTKEINVVNGILRIIREHLATKFKNITSNGGLSIGIVLHVRCIQTPCTKHQMSFKSRDLEHQGCSNAANLLK